MGQIFPTASLHRDHSILYALVCEIESLFEDILGKVFALLLKQFTKDVISALQIEKNGKP